MHGTAKMTTRLDGEHKHPRVRSLIANADYATMQNGDPVVMLLNNHFHCHHHYLVFI